MKKNKIKSGIGIGILMLLFGGLVSLIKEASDFINGKEELKSNGTDDNLSSEFQIDSELGENEAGSSESESLGGE